MSDNVPERRKSSHAGLIDSIMRSATQLACSNDMNTKALANKMLSELGRLRRELPVRRQTDRSRKA